MIKANFPHRISLQLATEVQESTGAPVKDWTTLATVYARIEPMSGRETLIGGGILAECDTKITIRFAPAVAAVFSAKARAVHAAEGRPVTYFNIVNVSEPDLARGTFELRCKSGTNEGE